RGRGWGRGGEVGWGGAGGGWRAWRWSPADPGRGPGAADLRVRGSRSPNLTWLACVPNVSSCPQARTGTPAGAPVPGGQLGKPRRHVLSVPRTARGTVGWQDHRG